MTIRSSKIKRLRRSKALFFIELFKNGVFLRLQRPE